MQSSETVTELIKALIKAQSEFKSAKRTKANAAFKNNMYATLDDVLLAVVPTLTENGLALVQPLETLENGDTVLETRLLHSSGEWISSKAKIKDVQGRGSTNAIQELGIGVTYMRRYMLSSLLGISTEDDNDGNKSEQKAPQPKATDEQKAKITKAIKDLGLTDVNKALKDAKFPPLATLTQSQAKSAIERLEKAVKAKGEKENA